MRVPTTFLMQIMLIVLMAVSVAGCEVVGGIFKAGFWVGAIAVVMIGVLLFWIIAKARG